MNLAKNSLHALALKDNERLISLLAYKDSPDTFMMVFKDNGYGIDKDKLEDIFLDYVTTKSSSEGTGFGLSFVRRVIEDHNGRIWAESEGKGKGSAFFVLLPLAKEEKE
jgi:signal transduction histidine kinase